MKKEKYRIGDILVMQGFLSRQQLESALTAQHKTKQRLGDYLVDAGIVSDKDIQQALHVQLGVETIDLHGVNLPDDILNLVPVNVLRKHSVLPVDYLDPARTTLILAMADPLDMVSMDDISIITGCLVEPRVSTAREINAVLDRYFGSGEAMSAAAKYAKEKNREQEEAAAAAAESEDVSSAPIVQIVRSIIEQAVRQASPRRDGDVIGKVGGVGDRDVPKLAFDLATVDQHAQRQRLIVQKCRPRRDKPAGPAEKSGRFWLGSVMASPIRQFKTPSIVIPPVVSR